MTSLLWCHNCMDCVIWQLYKKAIAWAAGVSFWQGRPLTLCSSYLSVPHGVELLNIQGSVSSLFISCIHAQGSLGHLQLVFLSCLSVRWVVHHPASLKPGIGVARVITIQRRITLWEQDMTLVYQPKSSSTPQHIFGIPGWALHCTIKRSGLALLGCGRLWSLLNC